MQAAIYNLATSSPEPMAVFDNDLDPVENLITQHILDFYGATQIHNAKLRDKLKSQIVIGTMSATLGSYAVAIRKPTPEMPMDIACEISRMAKILEQTAPYVVRFKMDGYRFGDTQRLMALAGQVGGKAELVNSGEYLLINDPLCKMLEDAGMNA